MAENEGRITEIDTTLKMWGADLLEKAKRRIVRRRECEESREREAANEEKQCFGTKVLPEGRA